MKVTIGIWKIAVLWAILTAGAFAALAQTTMTTPKPAGDARMPTVADQKVDIAKTSATGQTQSPSNRTETTSEEESAILPYYNNYLREYHLGPEDTISVEVFGQPNYSKSGIVIPPNSKISYPLIPGGVFVGGKTVDQVADDIKKKLNEYIIDPQVTVTLDKAGSARFSVLGLVAAPGVKVMNRRYNLFEAIAEAGGIQKEGDKKRILLIRINQSGGLTQTVFDMDKMVSGKAELPYLVPGDQIVVPEKRWSLSKIVNTIGRASALRILFGSPF